MSTFGRCTAPIAIRPRRAEAIAELTTFVTRYPPPSDNGLMPEAKQHLREARDRLSDSIYRVGFFYHRSKWYPGAIDRFNEILKKDPEGQQPRRG